MRSTLLNTTGGLGVSGWAHRGNFAGGEDGVSVRGRDAPLPIILG